MAPHTIIHQIWHAFFHYGLLNIFKMLPRYERTPFKMLNFLRGKSKRFLMVSNLICCKNKNRPETNYSKAIRGVQYMLEIEGIAPSNTSC